MALPRRTETRITRSNLERAWTLVPYESIRVFRCRTDGAKSLLALQKALVYEELAVTIYYSRYDNKVTNLNNRLVKQILPPPRVSSDEETNTPSRPFPSAYLVTVENK